MPRLWQRYSPIPRTPQSREICKGITDADFRNFHFFFNGQLLYSGNKKKWKSRKSASVIPFRIPLNLGVLRLGRHRCQSLGTFYRVANKLSHFEIENLLIDFFLVLTIFTYILPITVPYRIFRFSKKQTFDSTNQLGIWKYPSEGIGNAENINKKNFFAHSLGLGFP